MSETDATTQAPDPSAVQTRSELAKCIEPSIFPAERDALIDALPLDAPDWARSLLEALPAGETFANVEEIWEAVGGERF
ncbi:MAG TPA: hypothetical protein VNB24_07240 [Acidimicrobiales bacterium]|nr:hypothetical protein [Acidimicrobiales bacterium]